MEHLIKAVSHHYGTESSVMTSDKEYTIIHVINTRLDKTEKIIKFRNVGSLNNDSTIQFEIEDLTGKKTKFISFSIPKDMVDVFIERLQSEKKPQ